MKAVLVMFKSDGKRREFPLKPGTHVIGRQKSCKLRIPLPSVSRRHAELTVTEDGAVSVRDLGSSNGTFRNGSKVDESALEPGDELRVGPLDLILADGDDDAEISPPSKAPAAAVSAPTAPDEIDEPDESDGSSGAFTLDDPDDASESVESPSPLEASSASSIMAIDLDGDDDGPGGNNDDSHATSTGRSSGSAAPKPAAPDPDDDDDEDLDDLLANFGKSGDAGGSSEFDFLADVEILDEDK